jgi:hypothetical protein
MYLHRQTKTTPLNTYKQHKLLQFPLYLSMYPAISIVFMEKEREKTLFFVPCRGGDGDWPGFCRG